MAHVVIAVNVYLATIAIALHIVARLTLIDVAVGLGEDQAADAFAAAGALVKLAINLRAILVNRLAIAQLEVERLNRILRNVQQFQRAQHVPRLANGVVHFVLLCEVNLITWLYLEHLDDFHGELRFNALLFLPVVFDAPEVELLRKQPLIISILKFRIDFPVVSQIVDQCLESLAVAVEEYAVINFLQIMHARKHFLEGGALHGRENFLTDHDSMRSADVQVQYLTIEAVLRQNQSFLLLPRLLLSLNFI